MYDKLLAIGATMDWITPLWAFVQDWRNGPAEHMRLPDDTGWSGRQIERLLQSKGIRVWGLMMVGKWCTFSVRRRQAEYTRYWLAQAGVTGGGQWQTGPNAGWAKKKDPAPVEKPGRGWWDKLWEW